MSDTPTNLPAVIAIQLARRNRTHKNQLALISSCDFQALKNKKWYLSSRGYAFTRDTNKNTVLMHRLVMNAKNGDGMEVDHINGNRLDNRRENLRVCTHAENIRLGVERRKLSSQA